MAGKAQPETEQADDVAALRARIAELESQLDKADQSGNDQRVQQLEARIDALEERLADAQEDQSTPSDEDAEPEPEGGVVLDASPHAPSESGGEQSQDAPAPRVITKRVGGRWRTWTEDDSPAEMSHGTH